jgi:MFS family permease
MNLPAGRLTAIARPVDPRIPSNRFALFATVLTVVIALVASYATADEPDVLAAIGIGIAYGLGTFLVWAIARELHPDAPRAARLAVLAYVPAMLLGAPGPAALLAVLMAVRITVRTTGRAPTRIDLGVLVVLAGVAATSSPGLIAAAALAWAIHDDRKLPSPAPDRDHEIAAVAVAAVALITTVVTASFLTGWRAPTLAELAWLAIVAVAVAVGRTARPAGIDSVGDHGGAPLHVDRLRRARLLTGVTVGLALVWAGADAIPALAPAAAALVGVAASAPGLLPRRDLGTATEP